VPRIPELAVVEVTDSGGPTNELTALGVVISASPEDDTYIVQVADASSGRFTSVRASDDDLRIRYAFLAQPEPVARALAGFRRRLT
jgi:hypothetical protein